MRSNFQTTPPAAAVNSTSTAIAHPHPRVDLFMLEPVERSCYFTTWLAATKTSPRCCCNGFLNHRGHRENQNQPRINADSRGLNSLFLICESALICGGFLSDLCESSLRQHAPEFAQSGFNVR